jgi:hypothetical protein
MEGITETNLSGYILEARVGIETAGGTGSIEFIGLDVQKNS